WFSSNATNAAFLIVMAVTDPDASPYKRMSMFIVPSDTAGVKHIRDLHVGAMRRTEGEGGHGYIRYEDVHVPKDHLLGPRGGAFAVAQTRLGGGRIHHAMRTVGQVRRAFDLMCERALSRTTQGSLLAEKQLVQQQIADSWIEIEQFRLLVLRTAWKIDRYKDYMKVRKDIAAVKVVMPKVFHDVAARALHLHGSLGVTSEMPFVGQILGSFVMGIADGPTEVHQITLARQVLRDYKGTTDLFPTQHLPKLREAAIRKYADRVELELSEL
ncbi:MAG TPA: acyl-CoA dehydrogenase family protein, partial [Candidatus Binatus sp.]|nr:acyl-CoA dehydrogenase family protein [Candidatus Binatus sp.]